MLPRAVPAHILSLLVAALACVLALLCGPALADDASGAPEPGMEALARQFLRQHLAQDMAAPDADEAAPGALRVQVRVGQPARHLRLAPCARMQPWLPAGQRPWGRLRLGLRCTEGARWKVFVPVDVQVRGPGWVLRRDVPRGRALSLEDAALDMDVPWSDKSQPVYARSRDWVGQSAARPLRAGQALRHGMLRQAPLVQAARPVRVQLQGSGFAAMASGRTLASAAPGERLKVRLDSGRLLWGVLMPDGSVRVAAP